MRCHRPFRHALSLLLLALLAVPLAVVGPAPDRADALPLLGFEQIDAGLYSTCGVVTSGGVVCWGMGANYVLGNGSTANRAQPVDVVGISTAVKVTVGSGFACALLSDQTVKCWGDNSFGQLGTGSFNHPTTPVAVANVTNAVDIDAGWAHVCVVLTSAVVRCWGNSQFGQLGSVMDFGSPSALTIPNLTGVTELALGSHHTCALKSDDTVRCWGGNSDGQVGNGTTSQQVLTPTSPSSLSNVIDIAAGHLHTCAVVVTVDPSTTVKCWGNNQFHQLGRASATTTPQSLASPPPFAQQIDAMDNHTCVTTLASTVWCWGINDNQQLGTSAVDDSMNPLQIGSFDDATSVTTSSYHGCALLSGQSVSCWGSGYGGLLGNGSDTWSTSPVPVETFFPEFAPLQPARLLDTRSFGVTVDGQSQATGLVAAGATIKVTVRGRGGVVQTAPSVALNLTAVGASGVGYVTVWPCNTTKPTASNLNTITSAARANMVMAKITTSGVDTGKVCISPSVSTHLILDVQGYFRAAGSFSGLTPTRLYDSRPSGVTADGTNQGGGLIQTGSMYVVTLGGRAGVPATPAAMALNLTAVNPSGTGYLTVWPCDVPKPQVSHLNLQAGVNVANLVITRVETGAICFESSVTTHVLIDVVGTFSNTAKLQTPTPYRVSDSRPNGQTFDNDSKAYGPVAAGSTTRVQVAERSYLTTTSVARAVVLTVTSVGPQANGYLTVWPCGTARPNASNVNVVAGANFANTVLVTVGDDNEVCIYNSMTTNLIVDIDGFYYV